MIYRTSSLTNTDSEIWREIEGFSTHQKIVVKN